MQGGGGGILEEHLVRRNRLNCPQRFDVFLGGKQTLLLKLESGCWALHQLCWAIDLTVRQPPPFRAVVSSLTPETLFLPVPRSDPFASRREEAELKCTCPRLLVRAHAVDLRGRCSPSSRGLVEAAPRGGQVISMREAVITFVRQPWTVGVPFTAG